MKVAVSNIRQLTITGVERLDPVRVMLQDIEPGKGRITIECYGQAWSASWGGMGCSYSRDDVAAFVALMGTDYIVNCLSRGISPDRVTGDSVCAFARKSICQRRRRSGDSFYEFGSLDKREARQLYERASSLRDCQTQEGFWNHSQLLTELFGQEWFYYLDGRAAEPNPEYAYLERIVKAVQEALVLAEEEAV